MRHNLLRERPGLRVVKANSKLLIDQELTIIEAIFSFLFHYMPTACNEYLRQSSYEMYYPRFWFLIIVKCCTRIFLSKNNSLPLSLKLFLSLRLVIECSKTLIYFSDTLRSVTSVFPGGKNLAHLVFPYAYLCFSV